MQERTREESQTLARATALNELRTIELEQHRADISTRAVMPASLGARDHALDRTRAELDVATYRAFAEMHSPSRAREAEAREYADAQRHREAATDAAKKDHGNTSRSRQVPLAIRIPPS